MSLFKYNYNCTGMYSIHLRRTFWSLLVIVLFGFIGLVCVTWFMDLHFVSLASSFLNGVWYFLADPNPVSGFFWNDTVLYNSRHYWPHQPLPVLLIVPVVFFLNNTGFIFYQQIIHFLLCILVFGFTILIARKLRYTKFDSYVLATAFVFSSYFFGIAVVPSSYFFAHVVCTLLWMLIIFEFVSKRRWILIGTFLGCVFLTRSTSLLAGIFFVIYLLKNNISAKQVISFFVPVVLAVFISFGYNFIRFGNIFEQGYSMQKLSFPQLIKAKSYGLFSLEHLPGNIYYFLIKSPDPVLKDGVSQVLKFPFFTYDLWGMGIFWISPYLLWFLFNIKRVIRIRTVRYLLISAMITAVPIFLYYGVGFYQFGYRYGMDFFPLIFLAFMIAYRSKEEQLSFSLRLTIFFSSIFNAYLLFFRLPG